MLGRVVRRVEVVGEGRELGSNRVDLLDERRNAGVLPETADSKLIRTEELGDLAVGVAELLALAEELGRYARQVEGAVGGKEG